jgi:hypothetical protein
MESKHENIKQLPKKGSCVVNSDEGMTIQIILSKKGYHWDGDTTPWDPVKDQGCEFWWDSFNLINGEKYYILCWSEERRYSWSTSIASISDYENAVEFRDYFKEKKEYEGYFSGKGYGI